MQSYSGNKHSLTDYNQFSFHICNEETVTYKNNITVTMLAYKEPDCIMGRSG
jgi:hypothetical protein